MAAQLANVPSIVEVLKWISFHAKNWTAERVIIASNVQIKKQTNTTKAETYFLEFSLLPVTLGFYVG